MAFASWIRSWKRSVERRWALYQSMRRKVIARRQASRPRLEALEDRWLLSPYLVTSTADDGSAGTLRDAINQANMAGSTITEIDFNIAGTGVQTINLASALPALTASSVFINGQSENQFQGVTSTSPLIELNGSGAGSSTDGLLLQGSKCIISGLIVEQFTTGIEVAGSNNTIGGTAAGAGNIISGNTNNGLLIDSGASGVQVQGDYIGTDVTGANALANNIGVYVQGSNNTIGGVVSGARNVISGNSTAGVYLDTPASGVAVQGNYIGTDGSGAKAVANTFGVEVAGSNNVLGGTTSAALNVISGNSDGIYILSGSSGLAVQGNYIGTDSTGTVAVANNIGLYVLGSGNTIGGATTSAANLISGNNDGVFLLSGSGNQVQGNLIGTDVTGTKAVGNGTGVVVEAFNDTIGGTPTVEGKIISGNKRIGVLLNGGAVSIAVQGNYIGTDVTGTIALANSIGINDTGANNNTIGGTVLGARNVISANTSYGVYIDGSSGVVVQGNYIGTDVSGSKALGNSIGIYALGSSNSIGGTSTTAGNVISGNSNDGVRIASVALQLQGNLIGTDATGANALGNSIGVEVVSSNNTIGGTATGAGNVISGNSNDGVLIDSNASGVSVQGNYIGTDASGTKKVGNKTGVEVGGAGNIVGGSVAGAGNIISGNNGVGIAIDGGITGVQVQGNYIGTDLKGANAIANGTGVSVAGSANTIGGTTSATRNIISGNSNVGVAVGASGVLVQGNYIGTDVAGATAIANGTGVMESSSNNTIGGTASGAGNVISGNGAGVVINSGFTGIQVQGNYIGTNATGTKAVANAYGVEVFGANNTIGGTSTTARNLISGNSNSGVYIATSSVKVIRNYIGTDVTGTYAVANSVGIEVTASGNTIGGTATGAGDLISGNGSAGVQIDGFATGVAVQGNDIGTDATGANALANNIGVYVQGRNNTVGGTSSGARNVISGNSAAGVYLDSG